MFKFEIIHTSSRSKARVGKIHTPHGIIDTPNFVPVGTHATIKALDSSIAEKMALQLLFCNTYHLLLHPGTEIIKRIGGLHRFMNRTGPIITDSGGFQVFSLAYGTVHDELKSKGAKKNAGTVMRVSEEGVLFRSYRDGTPLLLTPESSVAAQKDLGADIIIPLDELPPYHISKSALEKSFERTHRWEERSLVAHRAQPNNQAMYAVVHGGIDLALRKKSCEILTKLPFEGFALGGSLGKSRTEMVNMLIATLPHVPDTAPRHLLGIGDLPSLEACIPLGLDTFDSSHPTRCARHGLLFTKLGMLKILQGSYKTDMMPPEVGCSCLTCTQYTRAYLHHLFKAHEITAYTLATTHNLHFMTTLLAEYRSKILRDEI